MNFQSLSYFIEITKDMNFTRTAERLHTSQQCLSGHIKRLEEHYGVKLFDRKPKLILTYAGEQLLASSEKILAMESDIYDKLYNISSEKRGRIRLQISPQRSLAYAPRIFPVFSQLHPNVDMELIESASTGLAKKSLREGNIDFFIGACSSDSPDISQRFLHWESFFLVASDRILSSYGHNLLYRMRQFAAEHGGVNVSFLRNVPVLLHSQTNALRPYMDACFIEADFEPTIRLEVSTTPTLLQLAIKEMGVAFCSSLYFSPEDLPEGISYFPLLYKQTPLRYEINLLYRSRPFLPPYMADLIDIIEQNIGGMEGLSRE